MELREIGKSISKYMDLLTTIDVQKSSDELVKKDIKEKALKEKDNCLKELNHESNNYYKKLANRLDKTKGIMKSIKVMFIFISIIIFGLLIFCNIQDAAGAENQIIKLIVGIACPLLFLIILIIYYIFKIKRVYEKKCYIKGKILVHVIFNFILLITFVTVKFTTANLIDEIGESIGSFYLTIKPGLMVSVLSYNVNIVILLFELICLYNVFSYGLIQLRKINILIKVAMNEIKVESIIKSTNSEINLQMENDIRSIDNNSKINELSLKLKEIYIPKFVLNFLMNLKYTKGLFVEMLMASEEYDNISSIMAAVGTSEMMISKEENFRILEKKIENQNIIIASLLNKNNINQVQETYENDNYIENKKYNNCLDDYLDVIQDILNSIKKKSKLENEKYEKMDKTKNKIIKTEKIELVKKEDVISEKTKNEIKPKEIDNTNNTNSNTNNIEEKNINSDTEN